MQPALLLVSVSQRSEQGKKKSFKLDGRRLWVWSWMNKQLNKVLWSFRLRILNFLKMGSEGASWRKNYMNYMWWSQLTLKERLADSVILDNWKGRELIPSVKDKLYWHGISTADTAYARMLLGGLIWMTICSKLSLLTVLTVSVEMQEDISHFAWMSIVHNLERSNDK